MSETPRTDAIKLDLRGAAGMMADYDNLCRQLERDNAALRECLRKAINGLDDYWIETTEGIALIAEVNNLFK